MKRKLWGNNFLPGDQPGYQSRFLTMDGFLGDGKISQKPCKMNMELADKRDLRKVFKSFQVPQLLPSIYTRVGLGAKTKKGQ